jgi:hypothetical protein
VITAARQQASGGGILQVLLPHEQDTTHRTMVNAFPENLDWLEVFVHSKLLSFIRQVVRVQNPRFAIHAHQAYQLACDIHVRAMNRIWGI